MRILGHRVEKIILDPVRSQAPDLVRIPAPDISRVGCAPRLEVFVRNARQIFQEADNGPDVLVAHRRIIGAEARHCGHLDAVLDNPERLLGPDVSDYCSKVGWGIQPLVECGLLHAGLAVTIGATVHDVGASACLHHFRIVKQPRPGGRSTACRAIEALRTG